MRQAARTELRLLRQTLGELDEGKALALDEHGCIVERND